MEGERILLPLSMLDEKPGPFTMSFGFDPKPMTESIRRAGVLNPPLVDREEGKVRIITGFRRILASKSLDLEAITCVDLSGSGLSSSDKLLLNLHDNLATRVLNGVEKGMALERLAAHFSEQELLERFMPLLGLPAQQSVLAAYLRIGELERDVRLLFSAEALSFRSVKSLLDMNPAARTAFSRWFLRLQFNFNQQSQFLDLVMDVSSISNVPPERLLCTGALGAILDDDRSNGPQKLKSAVGTLRTMRFPRLVDAEKTFQRTIRELRLPSGVDVQHSPFFENPEYRLEIRFRDGKGLRKRIEEVASIQNLDKIKDPWKE